MTAVYRVTMANPQSSEPVAARLMGKPWLHVERMITPHHVLVSMGEERLAELTADSEIVVTPADAGEIDGIELMLLDLTGEGGWKISIPRFKAMPAAIVRHQRIFLPHPQEPFVYQEVFSYRAP